MMIKIKKVKLGKHIKYDLNNKILYKCNLVNNVKRCNFTKYNHNGNILEKDNYINGI